MVKRSAINDLQNSQFQNIKDYHKVSHFKIQNWEITPSDIWKFHSIFLTCQAKWPDAQAEYTLYILKLNAMLPLRRKIEAANSSHHTRECSIQSDQMLFRSVGNSGNMECLLALPGNGTVRLIILWVSKRKALSRRWSFTCQNINIKSSWGGRISCHFSSNLSLKCPSGFV